MWSKPIFRMVKDTIYYIFLAGLYTIPVIGNERGGEGFSFNLSGPEMFDDISNLASRKKSECIFKGSFRDVEAK